MQSAVRWLEVQGREVQISLQKAEINIFVFSGTMDLIGEPNLLALNRELKKLRADIADLQARGLDPSNRLESMLRFEVRKMRTLADHNRDFLHLQTLKREVADLRLLRENINTERSSTHLRLELSAPEIQLLSAAEAAVDPSSPRPKLVLLMGFVMGVLVYLAGLLVRDPFKRADQTLELVETLSRAPVLDCLSAVSNPWYGRLLPAFIDVRHGTPHQKLEGVPLVQKLLCQITKNPNSIKAHKIIIFQASADNLAAGLVMQARRLGRPAMLIDGKSHTDNVPVPVGSENTDEKPMAQDQDVVTKGRRRSRILAAHDRSKLWQNGASAEQIQRQIETVKVASPQCDICCFLVPLNWSQRDISNLVVQAGNCVCALDLKSMNLSQTSDLICILEAGFARPLGWILTNAPPGWGHLRQIKKRFARAAFPSGPWIAFCTGSAPGPVVNTLRLKVMFERKGDKIILTKPMLRIGWVRGRQRPKLYLERQAIF